MNDLARVWLSRDSDPDTRRELEAALTANDQGALGRAFAAGRLEFGTAGLRGVLGPGPSQMNRLVVRETTLGLGAYLLQQIPDAARRGVVVAHDARRKSREFAADTAAALTHLGITVHRLPPESPTPLCAFAVRALGAAAGVMVTASHNPPEYNGYKVYWENGAQIIPPHDHGIAQAIAAVAAAPLPQLGEATVIDHDLTDAYLKGVAGLSIHGRGAAPFTIAYTPLHGVGARLAEAALRNAGFTAVHTVASQRAPDGAFPTVRFPNPEEPGAMDAVVALAKQVSADVACANDPDADRLAVAARTPNGDYRMLTGNELGVLLGDDRLRDLQAGDFVATTLVSSRQLGDLARSRGADYVETLTGFKWIANAALERETRLSGRFLFGYEEALGYTLGTLVRDKDGIAALVAFCELAAALAARGETVWDRLDALAREGGLYVTTQRSIALAPGSPNVGVMLRKSPPCDIGGRAIEAITDVLSGARTSHGATRRIDLPPSDVLVYELAGNARVIVRPSGTEPKLKCYYELRETVRAGESVSQARQRAETTLLDLVAAHQRALAP